MKKFAYAVSSISMLALLQVPQTAQAWHPVGTISKTAQNVSVPDSSATEADTIETAVQAKTGDIVRFTITIANKATANSRGYNDLAFIEVTDTVPAGLELVDDPSRRSITFDMENMTPGNSASKSFDMKVVATTNKQLIVNEACYTADSLVKDKPQAGCNQAKVRLVIPQTSSTSTEKPTPIVKAAVTTLPQTGVSNIFTIGFSAGILAYLVSLLNQKRQIR